MITLRLPDQSVTVEKADNGALSVGSTLYRGEYLQGGIGNVLHAMHDRIAELEAQLSAIGAGGVTAGVPLMGAVRTAPNEQQMREIWEQAGGAFHGPIVETATIPAETLFAFLLLMAAARAPANGVSTMAQTMQIRADALEPLTYAEEDTLYEHAAVDGWCAHDVSPDSLRKMFVRVFTHRRTGGAA